MNNAHTAHLSFEHIIDSKSTNSQQFSFMRTSTTMAATQESENPTNKNTIEFVSPIESVTTGKDATFLVDNREPRNNKRPSHDEKDTNKPDNKRSKNNDHASMIHFYAIPGPNSALPSQKHRDKDPSPNITMMN
jgi:hypothetical protein